MMDAKEIFVRCVTVLIFSLILVACTGCITRREIESEIWLTNAPISKETCAANPELLRRGFYRKMNDDVCEKRGQKPGCVDFVSFCAATSGEMYSIPKQTLQNILDSTIPEEEQN